MHPWQQEKIISSILFLLLTALPEWSLSIIGLKSTYLALLLVIGQPGIYLKCPGQYTLTQGLYKVGHLGIATEHSCDDQEITTKTKSFQPCEKKNSCTENLHNQHLLLQKPVRKLYIHGFSEIYVCCRKHHHFICW